MKRGAVWRVGAALATTAVALAACSAMIPVNISGGLERPVATFGADPTKPEKACLGGIAVHERSNAMMRPVWSIEARGRDCRGLRQVVYGETPEGFETTVEAAPLKPGVRYAIVGYGLTGGPLSRVPWRGGDEVVFENGRWRPVTPQERGPRVDAGGEAPH
ncbi:hypothetical protein [Brevundimonas diminuta]|uniref:hypothetical protein n=1 Tax=Brevundimonas diminuta TaxID=293 RepID=UPI000627590D|nr:hypothetical protein [Brevundimonas diminuta]